MATKTGVGATANGAGLLNGNAAANTLRPQFRRQGSSFGGAGHLHPMAVVLAPQYQRVDYSVTKGGARMWAVLFVFIFLCSSLYTVFSAKELAEIAIDLDDDGTVDLDPDGGDDVDEVATQQRRAAKDTEPSGDSAAGGGDRRGRHRNSHDSPPEENVDAADDDDDDDVNTEQQLFAGLRAKIEQKIKKVVARHHAEDDEEEQAPRQVPQRQRRRRKQEEAPEEKEEEKEQDRRRRVKGQKEERHEEEKDDDKSGEDDDDDDDDDDDEKDEEEENAADAKAERHTKVEKKVEEKTKQQRTVEKVEQQAETEEKQEEDEDVEEPAPSPRWEKKKSPKRHITQAPTPRACQRKNCPPAYDNEPRKALLKKKNSLENPNPKRYRVIKDSELDDFDDDLTDDDDDDDDSKEDDDDDDEDDGRQRRKSAPLPPEPYEVVAIKKFRASGRAAYKRHAITNKDDHRHRETLDSADFHVEKHEYEAALKEYAKVLHAYPDSPRAHFGRARTFDIRGEYTANNADFDLALAEYQFVLDEDDTPDALFRQAAELLVERARFRGAMHKALLAQRALIDRFPDEIQLQTDFALTFLMMGRYEDAKRIFRDILEVDPNNAIALAYLGYILKVTGEDLDLGVIYMRKGLRLSGDSISDARFFYHLGDGLQRLGRTPDAYRVYELGAQLGLFLSAHQRSMYNVEGLLGRPWWNVEQTTYGKHLKAIERQWVVIRAEALNVLEKEPGEFDDENRPLTVDGVWQAYNLYENDDWVDDHCKKMPLTCSILHTFKEASNATKSTMKVSLLSSGAQVLPHCGPTNTRLLAEMGLVVPSEARIRVGGEKRGWKTGRFIVFDDSFEHELEFTGASLSSVRLVLAIELWHPELDRQQRADLEDSN